MPKWIASLSCVCAPGRTRTFDLRIRNPLLYPAELRAQMLGMPLGVKILATFSPCCSPIGFVKQHKSPKTWERTRPQNLIRHKSERYYARAFAGGKEVWKSLKTSAVLGRNGMANVVPQNRFRVFDTFCWIIADARMSIYQVRRHSRRLNLGW